MLTPSEYVQWLLNPVAWIEQHFWLPSRIHPVTGEALGAGPIVLHPLHRGMLRLALSRTSGGRLAFQTVVWSFPKKTGKTTIAASVALWFACCYPRSEILLLANDGAQASDRVFAALKQSLSLHDPLGGTRVLSDRIELANGSVVKPLPCDAEGVAGANPQLTVVTELWAYTSRQKHRLWAETTPPPNLPDAMRWVESYAGYLGSGSVLEALWDTARAGRATNHDGVELLVNDDARLLYIYDHGTRAMARLPWQTDEYYRAQRELLPPDEFARIHANEWQSISSQLLEPAWLSACVTDEPEPDLPIVLGVDAGVVRATFAVVAVTLADDDGRLHVVGAMVFDPSIAPVDYDAVQNFLVQYCAKKPVVEIAYDPYQTHQMMTSILRSQSAYTRPFHQQQRGVADAGLISLLQSRRIVIHRRAAEVIAKHYAHTGYDPRRKRFVAVGGPNDALVALSMAAARASHYSSWVGGANEG